MKSVVPSKFIEKTVNVGRNVPWSFEGRLWQTQLFDVTTRRKVYKMSRQVGKTVGECAEISRWTSTRDNTRVLHVSPSQKQARKFSQDKLGPMFKESPFLATKLTDIDNVFEKVLDNNSKIYVEYAKDNPDRCRGITSDMVLYDEVQDQRLDLIQGVIDKCLFVSPLKLRIYAGTPKSVDNGLETTLWQNSDQREWLVRCEHHLPVKWIYLGERNIGKSGPICHHCGRLLDVDNGRWVKTNPGAKIVGFHVNQLHCKVSHAVQEDWDEILFDHDNMPQHEFYNEVLGESFDSAEKPLSLTVINNACDPEIRCEYAPQTDYMRAPRFAGIDYGHGKSDTVIWIGQFNPDSPKRFRYLFAKKYEGHETSKKICIPDMADIINLWQVTHTHVDYGGGFGLTEDLEELIKCPITANYWSDSAMAADQKINVKDSAVPMITLNRTKAFSSFIRKIHKGSINFFNWKDMHPFFTPYFLNIRKEVDKKDVVRYIRIGKDDGFHAALYTYAIAKYYQSNSFR